MSIHAINGAWVLETDTTAFVFGLDWDRVPVHRYWGARLPRPDDYPLPVRPAFWSSFDPPDSQRPEEYPAYAGCAYADPCLKVSFADGTRDAVLRYDSAEVVGGDPAELRLILRDARYPLRVVLHYRCHAAYDLIERWAELINDGEEPILVERAWSAQWHLPPGPAYRLTHLAGRWADEMHLVRDVLRPGLKVLESRRLTTGSQHNPWFAVDAGSASEDAGEVWFGALAWSGNWKLSAEVTGWAATRVSLGVNDWDFAWRLAPGETFTTPSCLAGYTAEGFGGASRRLHDYIRDRVLPHGHTLHKVLYNSWEATWFDVSAESQIVLAELAAEMGVELFVVDDGWFHGRTSDAAGLGDWWPDELKFPDGLAPLIRRVNELGMEFGLWIEPEMVNPDSDLYRAHPDWVVHFPSRGRTEARNQLILNMARLDVQDYLIAQLDRLLGENNIAFVKWDMNRNVSEPGWPGAPGDPRELWVRYVQGLYRVWGELRSRHPHVLWQSCSGGGGRADLDILRLADQIWVSDNTDPCARLGIQEGFSYVFPANTMESWVTDMGSALLPLQFRMHVSMCGVLGIGGHLVRWGAERRAEAGRSIAVYKEIRPIVQLGRQYRLRSAQGGAFSAVQYMGRDGAEGVLFAFRTHLADPANLPPLTLRGLEAEALYTVEGESGPRSGLSWMRAGLSLSLGDFSSAMRRIRRV
jgi:alpha-galactosidase